MSSLTSIQSGASLRQTLAQLPRDARDTLFLLGVIAWVLLPQFSHLPLWCSALVAGAVLAGFAATRFARASAPDLPPRPAPTASAAYGQAAQGAQASQPPYLPQVPANDDLKAQATP